MAKTSYLYAVYMKSKLTLFLPTNSNRGFVSMGYFDNTAAILDAILDFVLCEKEYYL